MEFLPLKHSWCLIKGCSFPNPQPPPTHPLSLLSSQSKKADKAAIWNIFMTERATFLQGFQVRAFCQELFMFSYYE